MIHKAKRALIDVFKVRHLIRVLFAIVASVLITKIEIPSIEFILYDLRTVFRPSPKPTGLVEVILIDKSTTEKFNTVPDVDHHRDIIEKIQSAEYHENICMDRMI